MVWAGILYTKAGIGPMDGVGYDLLNLWIVIGGVGFMARAEVENLALAASPSGAGSEDLATGKPADEEEFVRGGNAEGFAIHLLGRELDVGADALGDGVGRADVPEAFLVSGLAPSEGASVAHEGLEDLGVVAAVEDDETHAFEDAGANLGDDGVGDVSVGHVAPPSKDVSLLEDSVGEAVLGFVEGGGADSEVGVFSKGVGDGLVHAVRIKRGDLGVFLFVAEFAPDGDADDGFSGDHVRIEEGWVMGEENGRRGINAVGLSVEVREMRDLPQEG